LIIVFLGVATQWKNCWLEIT